MKTKKPALAILTSHAFEKRVIAWYEQFGRYDLPWQQRISAYRVWVSEIMLQQTQVKTVIPYFNRFMSIFPTIQALSEASLDDVLHLWTGLGYYARARNLHACAKMIVNKYQGVFPATVEEIIALPGIGRSTAGAILSIAFKTPQAILDGNVKRVLARLHAIDTWPGILETQNTLWELAHYYTPKDTIHIAAYTQAMMDLGATLCMRTKPQCARCPLSDRCLGKYDPSRFPGKKPKKTLPVKQTHWIILLNNQNQVLLRQRPERGIWGGLWCFPECDDDITVKQWVFEQLNLTIHKIESIPQFRHTFSHYHLDISASLVFVGKTKKALKNRDFEQCWYSLIDSPMIGLSQPVKRLLKAIPKKTGVTV